MNTLESIEFTSLETTSETSDSAEVSFSTIASHSGFTDTCTGAVTLVSGGDGWLLEDPVAIDCERS